MSSNKTLAKGLTYTHEAMIDLIIAEPTITQAELAECFSLSPGWIQRVLAADSFQARLAERKAALVDPAIANNLNERLTAVTVKALDLVDSKLSSPEAGAAYALDALGLAVTGLNGIIKRA